MARRKSWAIDCLEGREMMSITPILGLLTNPPVSALASSSSNATGSTASSGTTGTGSGYVYDPTTGQVEDQNVGGSGVTTDVSPARPNESNRRAFKATFTVAVQKQAPRLLDQAQQYYYLGPGYTNQFLHGTLQMRLYTPNPIPIPIVDPATGLVAVDSSGTPLVEQQFAVTGTVSMSDRSTQSGGVILANLVGSVANEDKLGRPTLLNLTLNGGGGSGGIYASSVGSGSLSITYHGNRAVVHVNASIFINGIGEPLDIFQSNSHH